jgi:hypothetical protein
MNERVFLSSASIGHLLTDPQFSYIIRPSAAPVPINQTFDSTFASLEPILHMASTVIKTISIAITADSICP